MTPTITIDEFATLVDRHGPKVRSYVDMYMGAEARARATPSDIVQSTVQGMLESLDKIEYRGEAEFLAYFRKRALRRVLRQVRKVRSGPVVERMPSGNCHASARGPRSPSSEAGRRERLELLVNELHCFSPGDRRMFLDRYLLQISVARIAKDRSVSETTVRTRLSRVEAHLARVFLE